MGHVPLNAVLLAERIGIDVLAERADRSLRTLTARRVAAEVYSLATAPAALPHQELLDRLERRPTWRRLTSEQFACSFGARKAILTALPCLDAAQLASMITRMEVRVLLGDREPPIVSSLQALAERELEHLFCSS